MAAAAQAGVELIVTSGMTLESCHDAIAIAAAHPQVFAAVGIHPWNPEPWDQGLQMALKELAAAPRVVAISEAGLDWGNPDHELQKELLRGQIQLALELRLPLILHCRNAHDDVMALLRAAPGVTGAVHGFSGPAAQLDDWLGLGFYVSIGTAILRPQASSWEATVKDIPEDRILLETDAYASPGAAGEAPGPARVLAVAHRVAPLRETTIEALGQVSIANLKRLLKLGA